MSDSGAGDEQNCPRCGSWAVSEFQVLEHEPCGAIKPASAFRDGDKRVCPDCGAESPDLVVISNHPTSTCDDCNYNFVSKGAQSGNIETGDDIEPGLVLESVRSRLEATTSLQKKRVSQLQAMLVVVLLLTSASVVAVTGSPQQSEAESASEGNWNTYQSIVIFRNDDLQPGYRTDTMRNVDQVFVDAGVPVTQGVVPAIGGDHVDPDGEFCRYLRSRSERNPETFEYALHGYRHEERTGFAGGSEFGGVSRVDQQSMIDDGTAIVESCIGERPTTFIPPLDTYDESTAAATSSAGYRVISGGGWFTNQYYNETGPFEANGTLHLPNTQSFVRNWTTNRFYEQEYLEAQFDAAHRNGGIYVQMLHYPTFTNDSDLASLQELIAYMQSKDGVAFMTVGEFATGYEQGQIERTDEGWRIQEPPEEPGTPVVDQVVNRGRWLFEQSKADWVDEVAA